MVNKLLRKSILFFQRNIFLVLLIVISIGLAIYLSQPLENFSCFIDWNTIITLSGLLLITMGIKESGFFFLLAYRISRQIKNERLLALFLIFVSASLSMFLTNDIALFIIVPLTLSLQDISDNDYSKMVVFEAIAVNVGSSLTPIGNPQNIFLWHKWGISFPAFIEELAPLILLLSVLLFIFTYFSFPSKHIKQNNPQYPVVERKMFFLSSILLILFVFAIELKYEKYFLLIIVLLFLLFYRKIILKADWVLILLFIFIFVDIHLLSQLKIIHNLFNQLNFDNTNTLFFSGAFLSQIISNVPTTVLLSHYSSNYNHGIYSVWFLVWIYSYARIFGWHSCGAFAASRYYGVVSDVLVNITGWNENVSRVIMFIIIFLIINRFVGFLF
ncbi:MAG: hypothetical protein L3J41_07095, partial [Melioribacteraceae bacterium]|nr:hypothetical protein [Melioribacteraceae bacterium]